MSTIKSSHAFLNTNLFIYSLIVSSKLTFVDLVVCVLWILIVYIHFILDLFFRCHCVTYHIL